MDESNINSNDTDSIAECEIFDFYGQPLGLTVIHPGGLKATQKVRGFISKLTVNTKILDIACGKGSTAFYSCRKIWLLSRGYRYI